MTKTDITQKLKKLEKIGFTVMTANSNHPMPTGLKGLTDHIILHPIKGIMFIEVKIRKDKLNERQEKIKNIIENLSKLYEGTRYYLVTDKNIDDIILKII